MNRRLTLAVGAAAAALAVPASLAASGLAVPASIALGASGRAAARGPAVTIRIEGRSKTLLLPTTLRAPSGSITRFGAPAGQCPAASAMGVLDAVSHHRWVGSWSTKYRDYLISAILGESYASSKTYFWEIFDNDVAASTGACEINLHPGDQLVFAADTGTVYPATLTAPQTARAGKSFKVKLRGYDAKGKAKPLAGMTISGTGISTKTNAQGVATITDNTAGRLVLRSAPHGYLRAEAVVQVGG